jgi:tRNA (uracil-5-)-methyltransferase
MYILRQLYRPILRSNLKPITLVKMSTSPPSKKARTEDFEMLPAEDAPVNNLFVPEATASTSTPKPEIPKGKKKNRRIKRTLPELYSPADVTFRDVRDFLGPEYVDAVLARGDESEWIPPALELWSVVELQVGAFTVSGTSVPFRNLGEKLISGESLSLYEEGEKKWAIMTPFAHPGDTIKAKIFKHDRFFSSADLVEIMDYSEEYRGGEGDRRVNPEGGCKYFGEWYVTLLFRIVISFPNTTGE